MSTAVSHSNKSTKNLAVVFIILFSQYILCWGCSMLMSVSLPCCCKRSIGKCYPKEKMNDVSAWINLPFYFRLGCLVVFTWGIICDKLGRAKSVMLSTACFGLFCCHYGFIIFMVASKCMPFFYGFWNWPASW
jgi:hypothetical protein